MKSILLALLSLALACPSTGSKEFKVSAYDPELYSGIAVGAEFTLASPPGR